MRLILLGAPGSGKRALLKRLVADQSLPVIDVRDLTESPSYEAFDGGENAVHELPLAQLRERLAAQDLSRGYVLDLVPGSREQAQALDALLAELGVPLDLVLTIDIDAETLLERMAGRQTCRDCGTQYNIYTDPPQLEGACDHCGGVLRRSPMGSEQAFHQRLRLYESRAQALIAHFGAQGILRRIRGEAELDDLYLAARSILAGWAPRPAPAVAVVAAPARPEDLGAVKVEASQPSDPDSAGAPGAGPGPGWKRVAEARGRLKRHLDGGKAGKKTKS